MDRVLGIRLASLYVPAMLAALPWALDATRPSKRVATGALLACAWNLPALLLVNVLAIRFGWWRFAPQDASLIGVPADLLLGWIVLWGAVPALLAPRASVAMVAAALVVADVALMPLAAPLVVLGDHWLIGEAVGLLVALLPGLCLARWTAEDRHVAARAAMQAVVFSVVILWIVPQIVFERLSGDWSALLDDWSRFGGLHLQLAAIPAIIGMAAVREFAERGSGTPIPFDPPRRLVTSGPYAYVANPMQLSMTLVLFAWGLILLNWWVLAAAGMAVLYGLGLAAMDEGDDMRERFGNDWTFYRRRVRDWIPRWRPFHGSEDPRREIGAARLYVAAGCGQCSEVARWFLSQSPRGLEIVPAETHPRRDLTRVTYDPGDGGREEAGVAAIARALEHLHLGWALVAWVTRVPGFTPLLQLMADASGGEPRLVRRSATDWPARKTHEPVEPTGTTCRR